MARRRTAAHLSSLEASLKSRTSTSIRLRAYGIGRRRALFARNGGVRLVAPDNQAPAIREPAFRAASGATAAVDKNFDLAGEDWHGRSARPDGHQVANDTARREAAQATGSQSAAARAVAVLARSLSAGLGRARRVRTRERAAGIVTQMNALARPAIRDALLQIGLAVCPDSPRQVAALVRSQARKWTEVIRPANIKIG